MTTQRAQQRERSREAIVLAAADQIVGKGYAGTSIGDIASAVGQTKGAVYFHFPSKVEIAKVIVNGYFETWEPIVSSVEEVNERGLTALRSMSREVALAYQNDVKIRAAVRLMRESAAVAAHFPTPFVGWMEFVQHHLIKAINDGEVRADIQVEHAAWQIVATFFGIQEVSHQLSDRKDLLDRVEQMWELLVLGLQPR